MSASESGEPATGSLVRSFMATNGRTAASIKELSIETIVESAPGTTEKLTTVQFEKRKILELLDEALSIAEISAELKLPIRTSIILVSELAADELVTSSQLVESIDTDFLLTIRNAIEAL